MVYLDWKRILSINGDNFTEDEKEELLEVVTLYSPTNDVSKKNLTCLLRVMQEILKFKAEQADSLMAAVNEMALKQGEDEARSRQELIDEIQALQEQLELQKRLDRSSGFSDDKMRTEWERLEMHNEELLLELQEREKELMTEKTEMDRLIDQISRLERERTELTRELEVFREESINDHRRDSSSFGGSSEKVEELVELVRQKNKHLMQLLDDVTTLESSNNSLQIKLAAVQAELLEATKTIDELIKKNAQLKVQISDIEIKSNDVDTYNKALLTQIEELIDKREKNERDLDEFAMKLSEKVDEWKKLLDNKDRELSRLKEKILMKGAQQALGSQQIADNSESSQFSMKADEICQLKEHITKLQDEKEQLIVMVTELRNSIQKEESDDSMTKIRLLECKIQDLETQLESMVTESEKKEKDISELIAQLRSYEKGEFGLSEALDKIRKLEKKVKDENSKIENLVASNNELAIIKQNLEDENDVLKEKLGMSPTHSISTDPLKKTSLSAMRQHIEKLNNDIIELKMRNRQLSQVDNESHINLDNNSAKNDIELKLHMLVEENDSLRKGLHDVLNSIRNECMGEIQVTSLERLLEALDARHISGWYHPAMRLQAQLHTVQGEANELRNRIRILTKENKCLRKYEQVGKSTNTEVKENVLIQEKVQIESDQPGKPSESLQINQREEEAHHDIHVELERLRYERELSLMDKERRSLTRERDELKAKFSVISDGSENLTDNVTYKMYDELEGELDRVQTQYFKIKEDMISQNIELRQKIATMSLELQKTQQKLLLYAAPEYVIGLEKELAILQLKYSAEISKKAMAVSFEELGSTLQSLLVEVIRIHDFFLTDGDSNKVNTQPETVNKELEKITEILEHIRDEMKADSPSDYSSTCERGLDACYKKFEDMLRMESNMKLKTMKIFENEIQLKYECAQKEVDIQRLEVFLKLYQNLYKSLMVAKIKNESEFNPSYEEEYDYKLLQFPLEEDLLSKSSTAEILFTHLQILYQHLDNLNSNFRNALCFPNLKAACKAMGQLERKHTDVESALKRVNEMEEKVLAKKEELDIQLRTIHELNCAIESDTSVLVGWHNKVTEFELAEARYKRQNKGLEEHIIQLDQQINNYKADLATIETDALEREHKWTEMQLNWGDLQNKLIQIIVNGGLEIQVGTAQHKTEVQDLAEEMQRIQDQNKELHEELKQKDAVFSDIISSHQAQMHQKNSISFTSMNSKAVLKTNQEEPDLIESLISLRTIIEQKENQIGRYQLLLKKSKENNEETTRRMQMELRNVHETLAQQSMAYSRIKHGMYQPAKNDVEQYAKKIHELEEELTEANNAIKKLSGELEESCKESERWRQTVLDRDNLLDETRERMEIELDRLQEELNNNQKETEKWRDMAHSDKVILDKINEIQVHFTHQTTPIVSDRQDQDAKDSLEEELRSSREECNRLKRQIAAKSAVKQMARLHPDQLHTKQEDLVHKIRTLEEKLQLSKIHEQEIEEKGLKRIRSVEEVTRWDERKKHQKSLEKLNRALKQKEVEAEVANKKLDTSRGLLAKVEREKYLLEMQVKNLTESAMEAGAVNKMLEEKSDLQEQIRILESELKALKEGRVKLSESERKKYENEILMIKKLNSDLEKENLTYKLQIEKLGTYEADTMRAGRPSTRQAYELQRTLEKAKQEIRQLKEQISNQNQRNVGLEHQIAKFQCQLQLWEEKDLADTIARKEREQRMSELHQEINQVKSELNHKSHLLGRVKILLRRAAAKEKALSDKVDALQFKPTT